MFSRLGLDAIGTASARRRSIALQHVRMRAAAAEMAVEGLDRSLPVGIGRGLQVIRRQRDDQAARCNSRTARRSVVEKGALHRVEFAVMGESFDA